MPEKNDPFGVWRSLETASGKVQFVELNGLETQGVGRVSQLPFSIKVLLESVLRQIDDFQVRREDVEKLAAWGQGDGERGEVPFKPARVLMQDFTGVPAVVDLAALRSATARLGGDPETINPVVPVDLVIDHSVQVDRFGSAAALAFNAETEFKRNKERYEFLRWGAEAFDNFQVVPPATGIVHQVNLEYLAKVVQVRTKGGRTEAFPDTLVGTDSHTTMINGIGVLGWGVGGIEAEAAMLDQPLYMLTPDVVGMKLTGELPEGATATDLVLMVTEQLRSYGVVGKFVEFFGEGLDRLGLADRATLANMAPEYGATMGFFPVDEETLRYLKATGRPDDLIDLVERYTKEQGLFRTANSPEPLFSETLSLDMGRVEPALAGPRRPQDRVILWDVKTSFHDEMENTFKAIAPGEGGGGVATRTAARKTAQLKATREDRYREHRVPVEVRGVETHLTHGSVLIAAITSCTNTSNPSVMLAAGLVARNAVGCGLTVSPHVKTSMAPGSRVVKTYLDASGLLPYLEALGFHVVGYGCTTCIGNSGPLAPAIVSAVRENDLIAAAVLSGNRNFEGRVNPDTRATYLGSPPLVVVYALAGTVDIDLKTEPIGYDPNGDPVYLTDIWPTQDEIRETVAGSLSPEMFEAEYGNVFEASETWNAIPVVKGDIYQWNSESTYIQEPPFFTQLTLEVQKPRPLKAARALAVLGDSVTTDHISPAGAIPENGPAEKYLFDNNVERRDFNSFGSRRGNHEVMMRGTFANIRLRNLLVPGVEGGATIYFPTGEQTTIYDAAMRYREDGIPLVVLAGKEYGTGSSRDWAAKGTLLLGVRAVIAQSYERIHRSNLVGMGVLPLEFRVGESVESLGLTGTETFEIEGVDGDLEPRQELDVRVAAEDGTEKRFKAVVRIDSPVEVSYYRHGGILNAVLRDMVKSSSA